MKESKLIRDALYNWKLRLILSAMLCIMGLSMLISMALGLFFDLSVFDKSIVSIAIFLVGVPAYLVASNLAKIDQYTVAGFLNENVNEVNGNAEVLIKTEQELSEEELTTRQKLENYFNETPLYTLLPDKPVKQAYVLFLVSMIISFGIWYLG